MKIFSYIIYILAIILIGYNSFQLDFNNLFAGKSKVAIICIIAALCAIVLLLIFGASRKVVQKLNERD